MGFFSTIKKGFRSVKSVSKVPVLGKAVRAVPFVGGALALADAADDFQKLIGGGSKSTPPVLPANIGFGSTVPGIARMSTIQRSSTGRTGISSKFSGPGGRFQIPGTGPTIPDFAKQFALDDSFLKTYFRAPKGYVVVKDGNGRPFPLLKTVARQLGLWKAAKKPPISVRDWESLKRGNKAVNKIKRVNKMAKNVANFKPR